MSAASDSEYEEEEVVVLAQLHGLVDDDLLTEGCTWQFVGIDQPKPVLQLGKYTFLGNYEDQVGTALFVKETTTADGAKSWTKLAFSDKKLNMQRVFLKKKGADAEAKMAAGDAEMEADKQGDEVEEATKDIEIETATKGAEVEMAKQVDTAMEIDACGDARLQKKNQVKGIAESEVSQRKKSVSENKVSEGNPAATDSSAMNSEKPSEDP